jgi:hypothetical protein
MALLKTTDYYIHDNEKPSHGRDDGEKKVK